MAITDVAQYAHLNETDMEALGAELDTIRRDIEESRGARDATYIRRTIAFHRTLEAGARLLIAASRCKAGWMAGTVALAFAKCVENMEIGHNVGHGQWDWMNDPEIHSTTWEWDMAGLSSQWRYSHNYRHHVFTNVIDMDDDLGFGVMRMTEISRGSHVICCSHCGTWCWRSASSGVSPCTAFTPPRTERRRRVRRVRSHALSSRNRPSDGEGLPGFSGAEPFSVAADPRRERDRQRDAQPVGLCGDLLRALP